MRKFKFNLILIVMTAFLLGVGFATWQIIMQSDDVVIENGFDTDDVIPFNDYASEYVNDYIVYNELGFFAKSSMSTNEKGETIIVTEPPKDTIDLTIVLYANKCYEHFGDKKIQIKIALAELTNFKYENEGNTYTMEHVFTKEVKMSEFELPNEVKLIDQGVEKYEIINANETIYKYRKYVTLELDLNENSDIVTFDLKYKFEINDDNEDYYCAFFEELSKYDDNTLFKMQYSLSFINN